MEGLPALLDTDYSLREKLLHQAVARGDIQTMLNGEIVPKAHITIYLELYARASQEQEPHILPPDLSINYDDLCAVFDRANPDDRKRGRPRKESSGWSEDRLLAAEMHKMIAQAYPIASSAAQAARLLVQAGRVTGAGTPESKAKRLERVFRTYYSS